MRDNYSEEIVGAIKDFLEEDDWNYGFDDEAGMFRFGLNLKGRLKKAQYVVDVHDDQYMVYAIAPIGADQNDRNQLQDMAEFLTRANYGLKNGNFELDFRDGEIRFKSFVDCDGVIPSIEVIRNSIYIPAMMYERYGEGIVGIIFGGMDPEEAINLCEKRDD